MLTPSSSSPILVYNATNTNAAHDAPLPPSPPLAGARTLRSTRSSARSQHQPAPSSAPRSGGAVEHARLSVQSDDTQPLTATRTGPLTATDSFVPAPNGGVTNHFGLPRQHTPSFEGGAPFDLAQFVHDQQATTTKSPSLFPFDFGVGAHAAPNAISAFGGGLSDMQSRALGFDSTLESPLDLDLDYSPFAATASDFTPSPWEASQGTPQLDYSSLFDTSAPAGGALDAVFPELSIQLASTVAPHSLGGEPLFASPITSSRPLDLGPVVSAIPDDATPQPQQVADPAVEQEREQDEDDDDYDDGGEYQPGDDPYAKDSFSSSSTRSSRKRKTSLTNAGLRDPATGKRVFHGVRTHATVPIVPLDAPIQPRNYKGDSKTARKVLPKAINKQLPAQRRKRNLSVGIGEGDEEAKEVDEETREEVDSKRKANTLAARKSRMRKAEYLKGLEERVEVQEREIEELRAENQQLRAMVGQ